MGMVCRGCGEQNRDGARFCAACGVRLRAHCATCDAELPDGGRFCDACGAPVAVAGGQSRKTVSVVFADLGGSTAMQERMDPESVRAFTARYYAAMRAAVEANGGRVVKFQGDGVMAVFGVPEIAENDAVRAVRAAQAIVDAFGTLVVGVGSDVTIRVGVNTGEVVVDEHDIDVVGDAVNVAARLERAAPPNGVFVGDATYRLTRDHATFGEPQQLRVKGRLAPVQARVLAALRDAAVPADDHGAAFVGRDRELALLTAALEVSRTTARAQLVTVLGSPGVGKSRLLRELRGVVSATAVVLHGTCDPSSSETFAPIAEIVREAVAGAGGIDALVDGPDRERVEQAIGFLLGDGEAGAPEQTFWGVRRVVEAVARRRPAVVVLDDAHWAEPLLLDLVEHLAEWLADVAVLLVVAARPELRESRPTLVDVGARPSVVVPLEGLDPDATAHLAAELLGAGLPADVASRVVAATAGNPLFVRELVRMLVDDGVLRADGDGWTVTVDASEIDVPPTISALLAARVERLRADERAVLEHASVLGNEFVRGALVELLPAATRTRLDATLESLRRKELVEPAGTYWVDEPVLRFHHALIRDAAYRRLLKEARASLHERAASWFAGKTGGGEEYDEVIGLHLEQAQANRRELGTLDDRGRRLAADAAARLARAAHRALHRDDLPAAAALAGRALACLDAGDAARPDLLLVRCEALLGIGDVVAARSSVDELAAAATGDARLEAWAVSVQVQLATLTGGADLPTAEQRTLAAAERLTTLGDAAGAAKAHRVRASVLARQGRVADTEAALDRALIAAREAGDRRQISGVLAAAPLAALWGPSPVPRAGGRCLDVVRLVRITTNAPAVEAISTRCQAVLEAFRGRDDAARKLLRNARRTLEDLGLRHGLLELEVFAGLVELVAGDAAAADAHLRVAHDGLRTLGMEADAAHAAALRARAALALGDDDRAIALAEAAERPGGDDLKTAIAWRAVKAEVLARRGDHDRGVALARAAADLAASTDALVDHADALAALGAVLAIAGDEHGARVATDRARALYEQKGATALAARLGASPSEDAHSLDTPTPAELDRLAGTPDNVASRRVRAAIGDWLAHGNAAVRQLYHPDLAVEDHRPGFAASYDLDQHLANTAAMLDLGVTRADVEVVATRGDLDAAMILRLAAPDPDMMVEFIQVVGFDDDGRMRELHSYELSQRDDAMSMLERLAGSAVQPNRATAWAERWLGRQGVPLDARAFSPWFVAHDRRAGLRATYDRTRHLENLDAIRAIGVSAVERDIVATRGERGAVLRSRLTGGDERAVDLFLLVVVDETDRAVYEEMHDDADAALAALEARAASMHLRNDAAAAQEWLAERVLARDWVGLRARLASGFRLRDQRRGFGRDALDPEAIVSAFRTTIDVGLTRVVLEPIAVAGPSGALVRVTFTGAADHYAVSLLSVLRVGDGVIEEAAAFDEDDIAAALAALGRDGDGVSTPGNGVTVLLDRLGEPPIDVDRFASVLSPRFVSEDRRSGSGREIADRDAFIAAMRVLLGLGLHRIDVETVAVRGDDVALLRCEYRGVRAHDFVMPVLMVFGLDDDGLLARAVAFDVDALDEALAELERVARS